MENEVIKLQSKTKYVSTKKKIKKKKSVAKWKARYIHEVFTQE